MAALRFAIPQMLRWVALLVPSVLFAEEEADFPSGYEYKYTQLLHPSAGSFRFRPKLSSSQITPVLRSLGGWSSL